MAAERTPGGLRFDFTGRHVLVTGASSGIGLGVAEGFAAAGAELTVLSQTPAIHEAAARLGARAVECDIADAQAVADRLADVGPVDVLVNNAGLERPTPLSQNDPATFERILAVNVTGTRNVTHALAPRIPDGGRILLTASIWGRTAEPGFSAYVASKHAMIGLARTWARELGPRRICVNTVCPGWVRTAPAMASLSALARASGRTEAEVEAEVMAAQAIDGLMEPRDMAATYLFLASEGGANITGQAINVDRGEVMS